MTQVQTPPPKLGATTNTPVYSLLALLTFVTAMTVLVVTHHADGTLFVALIVSTLPSLVASISAERASRDIRNGTIVAKAMEGSSLAIVAHEIPDKLDEVVAEQTRLADEK
jgi:hypothetical protein